jgi:hypothetical protein
VKASVADAGDISSSVVQYPDRNGFLEFGLKIRTKGR